MKQILINLIILISFLTIFPYESFAADNQIDQIINRNQREVQEKLRQQELQRAKKQAKEIERKEGLEKIDEKNDVVCFEINRIIILNHDDLISGNSNTKDKNHSLRKDNSKKRIINSTILSNRKVKKIAKNYINKCLGISTINNLAKELTNLYFSEGYSTSRVFIKQPQDLKDGSLELIAIEGKLDEIELEEKSKFDSSFKDLYEFFFKKNDDNIKSKKSKSPLITAYPFYKDKVLNIKYIEHGLEQINRLSSNNATMKIVPSAKQGYSKILITNNKAINPFPANISYNNNGQDNTGRRSASVNLNLEDLASLNENIYLSYTRSVNSDRDARRFSDSIYSSFSIPLGKYNFDYSFARSEFSLPTTLSNGDILYSFGDTNTHTVKAKRLMLRGSKYKTNLEFGVVRREIENFTEVRDLRTKSETGSRNLTIATTTLNNTFYINQGLFILNPSINKGLNWFNALSDDISNNSQKAQYTSYSLYSYFTKNFSIPKINIPLNYSLTINGQYSKDELYGSEQLFVGGLYTVRGFRNTSIGGDKGYNVKNELKYRLSNFTYLTKKLPNFLAKNINKISIIPFFDYGYVKSNAASKDNGDYVAGTGVKLNFSGKRLNANLTYSKATIIPVSIKEEHKTEDGQYMIYMDLSFKF